MAGKEQLEELDCLKDLDLFETMCKVLNIPLEVKKIWARRPVSAGHCIGSFQASFHKASECSDYRSEKNAPNK